ncbi:MAG: O-antigen translocase [Chitinophagales bacterium]|nr:O-antigen translocase [Chitinophagales bacterium]
MNLIRTSLYTSLSTGITFLTGFVVTKVVAMRIGPEGMAYYGQFLNTTSILAMLGTGAITTGVVKYLAEYSEDKVRQQQLISTAFIMVLLSSAIISLFTMACSSPLSVAAFKTKDFWIVYLVYGFCLTAVSLNLIFSSILNGLKKIKQLTLINIIASLTGMLSIVILSYYLDLKGVLINSSIVGVIMMFINIMMFKKWGIEWKFSMSQFDKPLLKKLFSFSLMAIVSGTVSPVMQFLVRSKIISSVSLQDAGYWQAVTRISDYYLGFVSSVLVVYYMPKLSELKTADEIRKEIRYGYKIILPVVGILSLSVWLCRDLIIHILFTKDFIAMRDLFAFQLIGDFLKIGSWILAYLMVAKAMTRIFIITEIGFGVSFVVFSYIFIAYYGVIGATYAFALNYLIYWAIMFLLAKRNLIN